MNTQDIIDRMTRVLQDIHTNHDLLEAAKAVVQMHQAETDHLNCELHDLKLALVHELGPKA